jgi:hypothetical protein
MATKNTEQRVRESWLECESCGRTSKPAPDITKARKVAEADNWLVAWPSGRRRGKPDLCQECRPDDEPACIYENLDRGEDCKLPAQYVLITPAGKEFPACGKHQHVVMRDLFNADPDQQLTIRRQREGAMNHDEMLRRQAELARERD